MSGLTKDAIFAADDLQLEKVDIPQWGGHVFICPLTGFERDKFEGEMQGKNGNKFINIRARMAVRTVCDQDGKKLFEDKDVNSVTKKSAKALDIIFEVATRLSGIEEDAVDDLVKNSKSDQSEDSGSN